MLRWAQTELERGPVLDHMSVSQLQNRKSEVGATDTFLTKILGGTRSGSVALFRDDATASECTVCRSKFTEPSLLSYVWLASANRKHHCRSCGQIFCSDCSSHFVQQLDARERVRYGGWLTNLKDMAWGERLCKECFDRLEEKKNTALYIDVFTRLALKLDLAKRAVTITPHWEVAVKYYFRAFHELQYLPPTHVLTAPQKEMLWNNRNLFGGHSRWLMLLIKACIGQPDREEEAHELLLAEREFSCRNLYCSSRCNQILKASDAVELLTENGVSLTIRKYLVGVLTKPEAFLQPKYREEELECLLPTLVHAAIYDQESEVGNFLITEAVTAFHEDRDARQSVDFCVSLFWWLGVVAEQHQQLDFVKSRLLIELGMLNKEAALALAEGTHLISLVAKVRDSTTPELTRIQASLDSICSAEKPLIVPTDPNHPAIKVDLLRHKVFSSLSRPISVPYSRKSGSSAAFIYKYDDLRKDCIVMSIIKLMNLILKNSDLNLNILTYNCIPVTSATGLIEQVSDSETIAAIHRKSSTIQQHILNRNVNRTVEWLRNRLVDSMAPYCVISYLLGFGDRHWDNILLTSDATLFHIDYEYIMGQNPANKIFMPYVRISGQLIEAIGGDNSKHYHEFEEKMKLTFNILRKHSALFITLLRFIPDFDSMREVIDQQVSWRFLPGVKDDEAVATFLTRVKESTDQLGARIADVGRDIIRSTVTGQ